MWGIIAITQQGLALAKKLKVQFPDSVIYTLAKWHDEECTPIEPDLSTFTAQLFDRHKTLVYIMATGIVVRSIARHLVDKTVDPAVVVLDEKGQFAISLLSGHLGGANAVASEIAVTIGATAVITTASDVQGMPSVDMIAQKHQLIIQSMHDAKILTAMTVNGQKVGWRNDSLLNLPCYYPCDEAEADGLVVVSSRTDLVEKVPFAQLIPQNITVGIGCRRGVAGENIVDFIRQQLDEHAVHLQSIRQLASIDIKHDEQGILAAAAHFGVPVVFVETAEIEKIEQNFTSSAFVKSQVGVSGVCEPAAFIAGGRAGEFISRKKSKEGITVAIFESAV
ncbi:cobalamin (vitamin B12) biosynthesis CbiG protein [Paludibacter propionicigenes WB4]|uniref:Cobalamin (Vitamin B12) biosynthesis CbiG protein n=1 Tax=Paludibacter propionicigenes (strain DSM 17365 / JCM 13257 / WB4) TaxID=694427 RepID=E4T7K9_PALPW|nr:cobalt-precorrin 5A hydrolase [Paludibacter propionicigenes]ADQ80703.1 cobalamin (vitamin B12) biosynthesis CbiG protein [Paludibacter propionicigenes WB4]